MLNENYHPVIDVPFWELSFDITFNGKVPGRNLVDNVLYFMDSQKNNPRALNSPEEKVVFGRDDSGFLHVGTQYPQQIERQHNIRDLKEHSYRGVIVHSLGFITALRLRDTLVGFFVRDGIVNKKNIVEDPKGKFDFVYKKFSEN